MRQGPRPLTTIQLRGSEIIRRPTAIDRIPARRFPVNITDTRLKGGPMDPKLPIRSIDYTVIFARQMSRMREFYGSTLGFPLHRELSAKWVEYRVGSNILALAEPGTRFNDPLPPVGVMSMQLAFRVAPQEVDTCA